MLNLFNFPNTHFAPVYQNILHDLYGNACNTGRICVLEGTEKLIKEELVRCIWFGRHFKQEKLLTDDGSRLEILSPGWWNSESGADFKHAEILLEGSGYLKGDVEIHVFASDWKRHGHNTQETYNTVCLHVVMWNDLRVNTVGKRNNQNIQQLTLSKYLDAELNDIIDTIDVEFYLQGKKVEPGQCQYEIEQQHIDKQWIGSFLDYAGDERILQKVRRYEKWLLQDTFEQIFYKGIMEALGYKNNKEQFLQLATIMPLEEIRYLIPEDADYHEKLLRVQTLLLGMAGLLPKQRNMTKSIDKETGQYINRMEIEWDEMQKKIHRSTMGKKDWNYSGVRPSNYPERRIAAISHILAGCLPHGILRYTLFALHESENSGEKRDSDSTFVDKVQSLFLNMYDVYWSHHYVLGGKKFVKQQKLIGKERASDLFINVLIPLLLLYARRYNNTELEKKLHGIYRNDKPHPETSVIKFMKKRILGKTDTSMKIIDSARRQQGLYQIFKDFCENDNLGCSSCALYMSLVKK